MVKKNKRLFIVVGIAALLAVAAVTVLLLKDTIFSEKVDSDFAVSYDGIETGIVNARVSVHDPSIIKADGTYYIFGSHMEGAYTTDLRSWTRLGNGYNSSNTVYGDLFSEGLHVFDYSGSADSLIPTDDGGYHVWAPDVIYNKTTGLYYMYYCTTSTWNASNLCYGVAETVEGPYEWQGALIYSGFTADTLAATDVLDYVSEEYALENYTTKSGREYNFAAYPNAIDPTVFYDEDDRLWMVYGSWSGGIFLLELDPTTGEVIHPQADPEHMVDPYFGKRLLGGGHKSIEGPY
ncbi:MAG: family 43 glycosylhydrolase, partial [Lachnospiraceae bacterium]|nr:family 43 glycosylhydrolase [Lachnospiraceae bacterium]